MLSQVLFAFIFVPFKMYAYSLLLLIPLAQPAPFFMQPAFLAQVDEHRARAHGGRGRLGRHPRGAAIRLREVQQRQPPLIEHLHPRKVRRRVRQIGQHRRDEGLLRRVPEHRIEAPLPHPVDGDLQRRSDDDDCRGDVDVRELVGDEKRDDRQEIEQELHSGSRSMGWPMIAEPVSARARP